MKKCTTCRKLKDEREFINDKGETVKTCRRCREYKKEYMKEYSKEHREQIKEYKKEYRERSKEQLKERKKEYRERNKEQIKEYRKSSAKYEIYAHKLTVEESPKKGKKGELIVRCTKCGEYFAPTNSEVQNRVKALEGKLSGECRLYCSQECRVACEIYGVNYDPYAKHASVERDPQWAKEVKERAKFTCERCGSKENLEAHHEIPVKVDQSLVNDEMNGICLCHECHTKAHSESGCTLADLRKI